MKSLKSMISRYMKLISWILIVVIMFMVLSIQILNEQKRAYIHSKETFTLINQVLEDNRVELDNITKEYKQNCLNNAEVISHILEGKPQLIDDIEALKEVAQLVGVDEIHLFDESGCIYAGTHKKYYGLSFDSGEQISFFKPLLEDKSLKLVQSITPNTAESKLMQYSALWSESGKFIVQVGMEPVNVQKVTKKNELSYIFRSFKINTEADFVAVEKSSGKVVGATDDDILGKTVDEIGLSINEIKNDRNGFHDNINGKNMFVVFDEYEDKYIGYGVLNSKLYERVPMNTLVIVMCIGFVVFVLSNVIISCLDKYVVKGIKDINFKLENISNGHFEDTVNVKTNIEFAELSKYINVMKKSLLENNKKMSYVLSKTNTYIAVYEYNNSMQKVRFTGYIKEVLDLSEGELETLASDFKLFNKYIDLIYTRPVENMEGVYKLNENSYVKIEEIKDEDEVFGVIVDVTDDVVKLKTVENERDIDILTGLYNRRGFESRIKELLNEPEKIEYCTLIMLDADGLKTINDNYGHDKGDVYLKKIAAIINNFGIKESLSARIGGDEFVLFLYEYDDMDEITNTIHTIQYIQEHSTARLGDDVNVALRFSFGYAIPDGNYDYETLLKAADEMMYNNKKARKENNK